MINLLKKATGRCELCLYLSVCVCASEFYQYFLSLSLHVIVKKKSDSHDKYYLSSNSSDVLVLRRMAWLVLGVFMRFEIVVSKTS